MQLCSVVLTGLVGALALGAQVNSPSAAFVPASGESESTTAGRAIPQPWMHAWESRNLVNGIAGYPREDHVLYADAGAPGMPQEPPNRPRAITYSNAYYTRLKIHRYASYATLPLVVSEIIVGQKLYDSPNAGGSLRSAHSGLAAGIGGLFGVNTVTGVWNMRDMRQDPNGRRRRRIHGILMLAADAGFVATAALAPNHEHRAGQPIDTGQRATHRAVALTSIGIATAGYLYMLVTR